MWFDGQTSLAIWCFAMIAAILPYIMLNLGILGRRYKVFMGDAGSTLIGFYRDLDPARNDPGQNPSHQPGYRFVDNRHSANGYGGDYVPSPA